MKTDFSLFKKLLFILRLAVFGGLLLSTLGAKDCLNAEQEAAEEKKQAEDIAKLVTEALKKDLPKETPEQRAANKRLENETRALAFAEAFKKAGIFSQRPPESPSPNNPPQPDPNNPPQPNPPAPGPGAPPAPPAPPPPAPGPGAPPAPPAPPPPAPGPGAPPAPPAPPPPAPGPGAPPAPPAPPPPAPGPGAPPAPPAPPPPAPGPGAPPAPPAPPPPAPGPGAPPAPPAPPPPAPGPGAPPAPPAPPPPAPGPGAPPAPPAPPPPAPGARPPDVVPPPHPNLALTFCQKVYEDIAELTDVEYGSGPELLRPAKVRGRLTNIRNALGEAHPYFISALRPRPAHTCNLEANEAGEDPKCDELRQRYISAKSCFERDAAGVRVAEIAYAGPYADSYWTGSAPAIVPAPPPPPVDDRAVINDPATCDDLYARFDQPGDGASPRGRITNRYRQTMAENNWHPRRWACPVDVAAGEDADCPALRARWEATRALLPGCYPD